MPIALRKLWLLGLALLLLKAQALSPGRYRILQGEVTYRAATALSAWSGRNESLSGSFVFNQGGKLEGQLCLDLRAWDSGNPLRDAHTRRMFEVERYPLACFFPIRARLNGQKVALEGQLELHGKKGPWGLDGEILDESQSRILLRLIGQVSLKAWGLKPPSFLGLDVQDFVQVSVTVLIGITK